MQKIRKYHRILRMCPKKMRGMNISKYLLENVADHPKSKKCLTEAEVKVLLDGHTVFEEKVDGGVVGLAWDGEKHLAIGKHSMIHYSDNSKKFYGLNSWIYENYEKIQKIPKGWIIFGEWLRAKHNIFYDNLPEYFVAFDIWDGYRYLDLHSRSDILCRLGFAEVPLIYSGDNLDVEDVLCIADGISVSNMSRFSSSEVFEGIVIKNYDKQLYGKYVRREFIESMEIHWLKKPLIENKLKSYNGDVYERHEKRY